MASDAGVPGALSVAASGIGNSSVLVVDDATVDRRVIANQLTRAGYRVTAVPGGNEALSALETSTFDLVLMDVNMPVIGGLDVLAEMAKRGLLNATAVIMMSSDSTDTKIVKSIELGALDFILKPMSPHTLQFRIARALDLGRLARASRPEQRSGRTAAATALAGAGSAARTSKGPTTSGAASSSATLDAVTAPVTSRIEVLAVDDSRSILKFLQKRLTAVGYAVTCAESGEQAMQILQEREGVAQGQTRAALVADDGTTGGSSFGSSSAGGPASLALGSVAGARAPQAVFDVILLDVFLPQMDGRDVIRRVKAMSPCVSTIPIIMMSSLDDIETSAECMTLGAEAYLQKPFHAHVLQHTVTSLLEKHRLRRFCENRLELLSSGMENIAGIPAPAPAPHPAVAAIAASGGVRSSSPIGVPSAGPGSGGDSPAQQLDGADVVDASLGRPTLTAGASARLAAIQAPLLPPSSASAAAAELERLASSQLPASLASSSLLASLGAASTGDVADGLASQLLSLPAVEALIQQRVAEAEHRIISQYSKVEDDNKKYHRRLKELEGAVSDATKRERLLQSEIRGLKKQARHSADQEREIMGHLRTAQDRMRVLVSEAVSHGYLPSFYTPNPYAPKHSVISRSPTNGASAGGQRSGSPLMLLNGSAAAAASTSTSTTSSSAHTASSASPVATLPPRERRLSAGAAVTTPVAQSSSSNPVASSTPSSLSSSATDASSGHAIELVVQDAAEEGQMLRILAAFQVHGLLPGSEEINAPANNNAQSGPAAGFPPPTLNLSGMRRSLSIDTDLAVSESEEAKKQKQSASAAAAKPPTVLRLRVQGALPSSTRGTIAQPRFSVLPLPDCYLKRNSPAFSKLTTEVCGYPPYFSLQLFDSAKRYAVTWRNRQDSKRRLSLLLNGGQSSCGATTSAPAAATTVSPEDLNPELISVADFVRFCAACPSGGPACTDRRSRFWDLVAGHDADGSTKRHLTYEDLSPVVSALVDHHPDLEPLRASPVLRNAYITAVLTSVFCSLHGQRGSSISFAEFRGSNLVEAFYLVSTSPTKNVLPFSVDFFIELCIIFDILKQQGRALGAYNNPLFADAFSSDGRAAGSRPGQQGLSRSTSNEGTGGMSGNANVNSGFAGTAGTGATAAASPAAPSAVFFGAPPPDGYITKIALATHGIPVLPPPPANKNSNNNPEAMALQQPISQPPKDRVSRFILDRAFAGVPRPLQSKIPNAMTFADFVWYILAERDRMFDTSMHYWFKCVDIDDDGYLSAADVARVYTAKMRAQAQGAASAAIGSAHSPSNASNSPSVTTGNRGRRIGTPRRDTPACSPRSGSPVVRPQTAAGGQATTTTGDGSNHAGNRSPGFDSFGVKIDAADLGAKLKKLLVSDGTGSDSRDSANRADSPASSHSSHSPVEPLTPVSQLSTGPSLGSSASVGRPGMMSRASGSGNQTRTGQQLEGFPIVLPVMDASSSSSAAVPAADGAEPPAGPAPLRLRLPGDAEYELGPGSGSSSAEGDNGNDEQDDGEEDFDSYPPLTRAQADAVEVMVRSLLDYINPAIPGMITHRDIRRAMAGDKIFEALITAPPMPVNAAASQSASSGQASGNQGSGSSSAGYANGGSGNGSGGRSPMPYQSTTAPASSPSSMPGSGFGAAAAASSTRMPAPYPSTGVAMATSGAGPSSALAQAPAVVSNSLDLEEPSRPMRPTSSMIPTPNSINSDRNSRNPDG